MLRDLKRALLTAGMILALGGLAWAHDEQERGMDRRGYVQGYRDGFDHGRSDRERRAGYDYHSDEYRNGGRGYDERWGDRDQFAAAYRRGYQSGYDDGFYGRNQRGDDYYDRDGRRGGGYGGGGYGRYGSNDPAFNQGYRDGIVGARQDIRENKRYDYNDHGWWQDAKRGYNRRYGDRQSYKLRYREGYEAGYRDTWENARGRGDYSRGYPGDYRNVSDSAYNMGYNDGIVGAQKDLDQRKSPDPGRHEWYQDANRGYGSGGSYGSREEYRERYRQGYVAGYNDTYSRRGY